MPDGVLHANAKQGIVSREEHVHTVISNDGTAIAFETAGAGPALLIVGGALADHQFYVPLANELAHEYRVYNFDRRGRGHSGDTDPYSVEREIEDVGTLLAAANAPVLVYGHSAGAALALRAAAAGVPIAKLALADPPFTPRDEQAEAAKAEYAAQAAHIQALHDQGDYRGSAAYFLQDLGMSDEEVEAMFQSPAGEGMIGCARALPYDYAMLGDGLVPTDLAAKVTIPTLILAAAGMPQTAQALVDAMPNARFQAMETSTHELPPAEIANGVRRFFQS